MKKSRLLEITGQFESKSVLVIGDLMLDSYLWGNAERISPEAPVPVIHVQRSNHNPGGAGNVALNLANLSCKTYSMGIIGDDADGKTLLKQLRANGINIQGVVVDPDRPTTVKTRVIAHNQQVVRVDQETKSVISEQVRNELLAKLDELLPNCDALILEDYNKGLFTPGLIREMIERATRNSIPVFVDPKKNNFYDFRGVRLFKPNWQEFQVAIGPEFSITKFIDQGHQLRSRMAVEILMVTRGAEGISIFSESGHVTIPTKARRVHDVSGAGDTVISTFALADISGASPEEAAILANYAAGRVCEEVGVVPITIEMLLEIVDHHNNMG